MPSMTRRALVIGGSALAGVGFLLGGGWAVWHRERRPVSLDDLRSVFPDEAPLVRLGNRLISSQATTRSESAEAFMRFGDLQSPEETASNLAAMVADDFAEGRVVEFEGWILSQTEVAIFVEAADQAPPTQSVERRPDRHRKRTRTR